MTGTDTTQAPLFDAPARRLGRRLHAEIFGALPFSTGRALDLTVVADAVRPLLEGGWRPGQLAARVGALPASDEPVPQVVAFLVELRGRDCPQQAWDKERAAREQAHRRRTPEAAPVASDQVREHWIAQARRALGLPPVPRPVAPATDRARLCSSCGEAASFFVTREVRLCGGCVAILGSGRARLAVSAHVTSA